MNRHWHTLPIPSLRWIILPLVVAMGLIQTPAAARTFNFPFSVPGPARTNALANCLPPPSAVVALDTVQPYRDGDLTFSQLDPAKAALRELQLAPLKAFTYRVTRLANTYTASKGRDQVAGACALRWLDAWARAGAMQKMAGHDSHWLRILYLAAWASDFAQVSELDLGPNDPRPRIRTWLTALAHDMRLHFDTLPPASTVRSNNHRYWAGFAAIAVAADTDDRVLFDWGIASARVGLNQITATGTLPLEIGRGSKARLYSIYATQALSLIAEYAAANRIDLYQANNRALRRLASFSLQSLWQPQAIEALAKARQEPYVDETGALYTQGLAWLEYYMRRFPRDVPNAAAILAKRPLINDEVGGNLTLLVGRQ